MPKICNMQALASRPIGIFDSGTGGLTVAHAVSQVLPNEQIIYFGDIAHLPYGDKSEAAIQAYSVKITDFLLQQGCKVILIACNSASSAAYELLKAYTASKAKVISVIDPMVHYVCQHYQNTAVGLIGTKLTVASGIYERKIQELGNQVTLNSLPTPLLVPIIEEGFYKDHISEAIIHKYLKTESLQDIAALILGCTHYPLIKPQVEAYYQGAVEVIDSSRVVAEYLKHHLGLSGLAATTPSGEENLFFVSDITKAFEDSTALFFQKQVTLKKYELWE